MLIANMTCMNWLNSKQDWQFSVEYTDDNVASTTTVPPKACIIIAMNGNNSRLNKGVNHPALKELKLKVCYLCDKPLSGLLSKDHIIPNTMYPKGAEYRPQLQVHASCNNSKSLSDERVKMRILMMSSLNPVAGKQLMDGLLLPAAQQRDSANLIGMRQQTRDYRLARTLAKDFRLELELPQYVQVHTSDKHVSELNSYARKMTRGLFIRNVDHAQPGRPKLRWFDGNLAALRGESLDSKLAPINRLIHDAHSRGTLFGQMWPGHISYVGSAYPENPKAGFVWLEFYQVYGVLAIFGPSVETPLDVTN